MSGWYGVDLDGTLAEHYWPTKGPYEQDRIGDPIPAMVARVKGWLAGGIEVRVFTARVGPQGGIPICADSLPYGPFTSDEGRCTRCGRKELTGRAHDAIAAWTREHIGVALAATATKDFGMIALWDDRAVRVVTNTGKPCCPVIMPELSPVALVNSGLNGFAVELFVESIRQFRDFETHGPIAFRMRGVKFTLEYDAESDRAHSDRREAAGLPRDDYHWTKRPNGDLAAAAGDPGEQRVTIRDAGREAVVPRWALDAYVAEATQRARAATDEPDDRRSPRSLAHLLLGVADMDAANEDAPVEALERALADVATKAADLSVDEFDAVEGWAEALILRASDHDDIVAPDEPRDLLHRLGVTSHHEAVEKRLTDR